MMQEVELHHDQVKNYMRDDLDYLATQLMPDEAVYPFPPFYRQVWALILSNLWTLTPEQIFRFALGLPRGHVKTNFLKILICYMVLHDYKINFILIVCATEPLAENFLNDIHDMLKMPLVRELYGSWENSLTRSTMKVKISNFQNRGIIIAAIGAGTSLRGLNLKRRRPQLIICDDVQTKENDGSPREREKLLQWLVGTLFKARSKITKAAILYVGNMYSTDCILYKFSKLPNWTSLITGAILADGTALWPELNSIRELVEEYEHDAGLGEASTWFAEIQNDPIGASAGLLDPSETIAPWEKALDGVMDTYHIRFITVDPAGNDPGSDDNVVATHCLEEEETIGTVEIANGNWSPGEVVKEIVRQVIAYRVGIIFIESNAYQGSLAYWLKIAFDKLGLEEIKIVPIHTGAATKYKRIKAFVRQWTRGKWHFYSQGAYNKVIYQLYAYKTTKRDNVDDCLDVCSQAVLAVSKHYRDILNAAELIFEESVSEYTSARVRPSNTIIDRIRLSEHGRR